MMDKHIDKATIHFQKLLQDQLARVDRMSAREEQTDFESLDPIIIGIIGGDGIGPFIAAEARRVLESLLQGPLDARWVLHHVDTEAFFRAWSQARHLSPVGLCP